VHQTAAIQRFAADRADIVAASRFLANPAVDLDALRDAVCQPLAATERRVLVIEDTTEINLTRHAGRLRAGDAHLGPITAKDHVGFFVHPAFVVDEATGVPLGLAALDIYNRAWGQPGKRERRYSTLPIEAKESFRWLRTAQEALGRLHASAHRTVLCDREGDIYDLFATLPDDRTTLVVRSRTDRRIVGDRAGGKLYDALAQAMGVSAEIEIARSGQRGRRTAAVEVRWRAVALARPQQAAATLPAEVGVWAVEVCEVGGETPRGEEPLLWRLVTTAPVETAAEALAVATTYARRWQIEELFRALKSQGLDIEASQVATGLGLKKLCVLALQAAVQVLALVAERDGASGVSARLLFSASEVACLAALSTSLAGSTAKQRNPHPESSLAWASWVIARLGGWHCYGAPPGVARMRRGLERFADQHAGWTIAPR
jgi:hypothetical protein